MKLKNLFSTGLTWFWIAVLVLFLDRITKTLALTYLTLYEPLPILPIFNLTLWTNKGMAFSFLSAASGWQNLFLGGLAATICILILVWLYRLSVRQWWMSIALCFIFGGAMGNLWDRIMYGSVIDFLHFHIGVWSWPIFNVADGAICIGAAMVFWRWMRETRHSAK